MPTYDAGVSGLVGTVGVTILLPAGTVHVARTTAGITEPVAGSGVYHVADHDVNADLIYVWDNGVGTVGGSELVKAVTGNGGDKTLPYRVLLDSDGDGVADTPNVGIPNITCTLTSDLAGTVQIGSSLVSDAQGNVTFRGLVAGTYYVWREGPGYAATTEPDTEVVT